PRRTVLLASAGTTVTAVGSASLEVADAPCFAFMSANGLLARTSTDEAPGEGGGRANHDVVVSAVRTTARAEIGVVTSRGRLLKVQVLDMPELPAGANDPNLQGGLPLSEILSLEPGERALCLSSLGTAGPGLALGTRQGIVKRVTPEVLSREDWEVIGLKDGDEVVGAVELATGNEELCFITAEAQLLHFGADAVRPQGRSGGGIAGVRLAGRDRVVWFGALDPADAVVVTASGSSTALPGTEPGAVKVAPFSEYPAKGRATGGVRCHRFLKGEDSLVFAWAGTAPARAAAASGAPVELPEADGRRDGSGVPGSQPIVACAPPVARQLGVASDVTG
ncbi:DNA gyrase C-terminal beta-propeller domain-containing protein, partial [Nocardioides sp. 616]|uniref:DNA gyrase C-terminal beta-propeller domain-containing protein n=1 Tax=Nocardioides sp. 616 TaxID=2268090 RepID=UPI0023DD5A7E